MTPIISSLLDTDLYKYTMQQVMWRRYPEAQAVMSFSCRSGELDVDLAELRQQIDCLADLQLSEEELTWLSSFEFFKSDFIQWLASFRLDPRVVTLSQSDAGIQIDVRGCWADVTHFEIFILAIVSELHCRDKSTFQRGREKLQKKINELKASLSSESDFRLVDFGTRRRFSSQWHEEVVTTLQENLPGIFVGTSNLHLARIHGLSPVGTMAHEWLQAHQVLGESLLSSQKDALQRWLEEYKGQLGIALTDTINMKAFLADFNRELAEQYSGVRQDSGDPVAWGELALAHYSKLGIDARNKAFVFSDKLDFEKALEIYLHFHGRVKTSFGIGTYLTNDVGVTAPNIVLKLVEVNGCPVAKLSDSPGKVMCKDDRFVNELRKTFEAA